MLMMVDSDEDDADSGDVMMEPVWVGHSKQL
jgi:hypothetical protein